MPNASHHGFSYVEGVESITLGDNGFGGTRITDSFTDADTRVTRASAGVEETKKEGIAYSESGSSTSGFNSTASNATGAGGFTRNYSSYKGSARLDFDSTQTGKRTTTARVTEDDSTTTKNTTFFQGNTFRQIGITTPLDTVNSTFQTVRDVDPRSGSSKTQIFNTGTSDNLVTGSQKILRNGSVIAEYDVNLGLMATAGIDILTNSTRKINSWQTGSSEFTVYSNSETTITASTKVFSIHSDSSTQSQTIASLSFSDVTLDEDAWKFEKLTGEKSTVLAVGGRIGFFSTQTKDIEDPLSDISDFDDLHSSLEIDNDEDGFLSEYIAAAGAAPNNRVMELDFTTRPIERTTQETSSSQAFVSQAGNSVSSLIWSTDFETTNSSRSSQVYFNKGKGIEAAEGDSLSVLNEYFEDYNDTSFGYKGFALTTFESAVFNSNTASPGVLKVVTDGYLPGQETALYFRFTGETITHHELADTYFLSHAGKDFRFENFSLITQVSTSVSNNFSSLDLFKTSTDEDIFLHPVVSHTRQILSTTKRSDNVSYNIFTTESFTRIDLADVLTYSHKGIPYLPLGQKMRVEYPPATTIQMETDRRCLISRRRTASFVNSNNNSSTVTRLFKETLSVQAGNPAATQKAFSFFTGTGTALFGGQSEIDAPGTIMGNGLFAGTVFDTEGNSTVYDNYSGTFSSDLPIHKELLFKLGKTIVARDAAQKIAQTINR